MSDLFSHQRDITLEKVAPLADRLRPRSLDDFVGQESILGPGRLLRRAIAADRVGNLILHGPPGVGKTTLARIIAGSTRAHFSSLNAVLAGVKDLRIEVDGAKERLARHGLRTTLFIDEVHRFNSAQQDALLPWVENGTLTLIGATTENPYFEVNKALVSRSRLFRLQPLEPPHLHQLLDRALRDAEVGYGDRSIRVTQEAADHLVDVAGGDARSLLNALELAVETTQPNGDSQIVIDLTIAEESIQQRAVLYDKQGDAHFDTISAFIKSLRGSDADAALFWLARMVEAGENPRFIFRRMLIAAGEDIGLADPQAVVVVEACAAAFERVGLPEGLYPLAQAALYLAGAEKSNSVLGFFDALKSVRETNRQQVPSHLRDAHRDGQAFGDGVGYRYPHAYAEHWVAQQYLPNSLQGEVFWQPGNLGWEGQRRERLQQRRAAQLAAAAELAADQGDVLSSSPDDPQLERWLQRQATAEGERLDDLRRRFWDGAHWQRHDRVLVLEARSLLWALDPLAATPEGGVVITVGQPSDLERLQAQLQVLDALRQPQLLVVQADAPASLRSQLEPGEGSRFDWAVARQPWRGLNAQQIDTWIAAVGAQMSANGQWRLLFSTPQLGPAAGLQALSRAAEPALQPLLEELSALERQQLQQEPNPGQLARQALIDQGWRVEQQHWQEALQLELSTVLLARWLAPESTYLQQLNAMRGAPLTPAAIELLQQGFQRHLGQQLPQTVAHTLLRAHKR
ncbi:AAA family ATPase [Cyanobium sp. Alchichica 3B3-8F6]|uniref:AAA family ATPase n=1 Tax=Cyanobium sp. Alchichica 3B3-8F6 TaxID=2823696 RepID=UPI0020CE6C75|nr:AAA family ATPase [Cyanobium sp. Alchichica 3B3-8F6]MCP9882887.1 AAA family ATPase [Cyanobium sp. Alchichica 3B3-8F6]